MVSVVKRVSTRLLTNLMVIIFAVIVSPVQIYMRGSSTNNQFIDRFGWPISISMTQFYNRLPEIFNTVGLICLLFCFFQDLTSYYRPCDNIEHLSLTPLGACHVEDFDPNLVLWEGMRKSIILNTIFCQI